jgi:Arylsulfotransferase (ASST)
MPSSGAKTAWPYDWFHLNSIAVDGAGDLLISARSTWAVYDIDAGTGVIRWQLGGRRPTFTMGPGTQTAWQHDAQPLGPDTISLFDNGGPPSSLRHSRGIVLRIDQAARTAELLHSVAIRTPIFAQTQGDLQLLPSGNWWIGWGNVNESSEVSAAGTQLFEAHTPAGSESYRTFRYRWSARPATRPQAVVRRGANGAPTVYVSWNGATAVARWRVEAGRSPARLASAAGASPAGFETAIAAPRSAAVVRAVALDARGRVLGASLPVTVPPRATSAARAASRRSP